MELSGAEIPDVLTGVADRSTALAGLDAGLRAEQSCHCVVFDIDNFARLNDHFGFVVGDEVLAGVAQAISSAIPDFNVGRLSGDIFIAVGNRTPTSLERAKLTVLEVETSIGPLAVELSLGESSTDVSGRDGSEMLGDSIGALQVAKQEGGQRSVSATPAMRLNRADRRRVASEVKSALENNELSAWAQAIFDLEEQRPVGFELLARWSRGGRFEPPSLFVPIVEALGLSSLLGEFMVREAVALLRRLSVAGHDHIFVAVNLSAKHVAQPLLPSLIALQLERHNVAPHRLVVELTETERLPDSERGRTAIDRLRSLGIGVASDDVGSGWSSLTQMIRSRFTHVKLDRDLVQGTPAPGGTKLIEAIRLVAEGVGQIAIAEGVETQAELDAVRAAGYRLCQGWWLHRPSPIDEALLLVGG